MIATGGLLRINRRQDSLRSKNRAENKRKRKAKKRKKNDVVVVKGKLNLCSPAGVVAAVGVGVLMVGITMAVLGYWPHDSHVSGSPELQKPGQQANGRMSYSKSPQMSSNWTSNKPTSDKTGLVNQSLVNTSVYNPPSSGFLSEFLDTYLYSDNLKVFGPLVMGIGIFLFICANAVLHENRDKTTKIINLRDIYSTVIDLHGIRTKDYSPLNGMVNYMQSRSMDVTSGTHSASGMLTRSSWPSTALGHWGELLGSSEQFRRTSLASRPRSWSREAQTFTDTVYSIYRDHTRSAEGTPQPKQWETTSIVTSSVNAFTLPVIKLNNCEVEESERAEAKGHAEGEIVSIVVGGDDIEEQAGYSHCSSAGMDNKAKDSSTIGLITPQECQDIAMVAAEQQGALKAPPQGPQMQLFPPSPVSKSMGSRLSLNSLSDQPRSARRCSLSVSVCRQGDRARRFSCPRLERSNSKGYIKLTDLGGESFEAPDIETSCLAANDQDVAVAAAAAQAEGAPVTPNSSLTEL